MDEDMNEFLSIEVCSVEEYDPNYEFEAPRYYDFSRTESDWEAEDAERWFDFAGTYPPSPFLAKMNWGKDLYIGGPKKNLEVEDHENMNSIVNDTNETPASVQCGVKETKSLPEKLAAKPSSTRSSTLMKPTASHLAKQRSFQEVQFNRLLRSQKFPVKEQETTSQCSSIFENSTTKRQKLEFGYLRKAADLKHRAALQHKLSKKVHEDNDLLRTKLKVTIPREPRLETAHRALMHSHRSKRATESAGCANSNLTSLKAQNFSCMVCSPKKVIKQLPEFQIVDTQNPIPASQSGKTECKRPASNEATKPEKCEVKHKLRARPPDKEHNLSPSKPDAAISLFQKLTLESEVRTKSKSQSKSLKENAPSMQQLREVVVRPRKEKP